MKACIINPPTQVKKRKFEEWSDNSVVNVQYLGIAYLEAALLEAGYEVTLYDCPSEGIGLNQLYKSLKENKFDIVGISVFYYNLFNFERILFFLENKMPDTFLFIGGYAPTLDYKKMLKTHLFVKAIILGEGEKIIVDLFKNLEKGMLEWKNTKGIAYCEGREIKMNIVEEYTHLDKLPFPNHQLRNKCRTISIVSSRGCYGNCGFCSEKKFSAYTKGPRIRFRTVENVIEEIDIIVKNLSVKNISFCDSNFLPASKEREKWLIDFLKVLESRRYKVTFNALLRANDIIYYKNYLPILKKVGFKYLFVGIESFIQRQLDFYEKGITVEKNIQALKLLIENGIQFEFGFLILDPFSTIEEIRENLKILNDLNLYANIHYTQEFFSVGSLVFSISGTKICDVINEHGLNASNDIGYHFVNRDIQLYYKILDEWINIMKEYQYIRFLIDKCYYYNEIVLSEWLRKCLIALYRLDVNCMNCLLYEFKNAELARKLISTYKNKLNEIVEKYNEYICAVIELK
ncbi:MAG: radical SAM protein [Lachnospiraceae bacterium]|nr:radical SAM protein [Lachnospiraceae bacterium]